ncbi:MAG: methylenetetrahydrofolate reductase [NAD(P)H] [Pseudomonadota bacterium]|jgi:methylenetetrahydrofolate reductase (NADPH)|nr:methylenetetrahydrofolate reductase [NAD(P)H] [Syntrophaceae bacterium]MBP7033220.1 methylenetetrahydrofolate reductase [NAD(P)H] [Syntrophobacterales bacterium]MDI9556064.1 methylenetetrahydrofolate reductase [NAD(P)H] [Pseudomonadota bacterium]NLX30345.1 methylenetetrahydrofolate reductase [NAD(P)H] [Deltaproteobacteria bacterium]HNU85907.1 methylenetetrahydrofolate reductase [NAD(P)H] [Syntrophales bacterium]
MLIRDLFNQKKRTLSFEVFPPVREGNLESLFATIAELEELKPDFISVTYGAGGGTRDKTIEIASRVKNEIRSEALAHLTCVASSRDDIARILEDMKAQNIENILALRGDPPRGEERFVRPEGGFGFANELVEFIKAHGAFSIGVAGYPEGHPEAPSVEDDLKNLKRKVDAGADFIVTQLFFHNDDFYRFRDRVMAMKIRVPVIPGIFPILNYRQILRITELCGSKIPPALGERLCRLQDKPGEVEKYGIEYAQDQAWDLVRNEVCGLHICTMNRSRAARTIVRELAL